MKSDKAQWGFAGSLSTLIGTSKESILQKSGPIRPSKTWHKRTFIDDQVLVTIKLKRPQFVYHLGLKTISKDSMEGNLLTIKVGSIIIFEP